MHGESLALVLLLMANLADINQSKGYHACLAMLNTPSNSYGIVVTAIIPVISRMSAIMSLWQAEQKRLHALGEPTEPIRGRFSNISREIIMANQPAYYLEGLGISGLTFKPFAKVRLSSSYMHLYIDIGDSLKPLSKNKRRKAIRHGKPLPKAVSDRIDSIVNKAVRHYLKR